MLIMIGTGFVLLGDLQPQAESHDARGGRVNKKKGK